MHQADGSWICNLTRTLSAANLTFAVSVPAILVQTTETTAPMHEHSVPANLSPILTSPAASPRTSARPPLPPIPDSGRLTPVGSPGDTGSVFWASPGSPTGDPLQSEGDLMASMGGSKWGGQWLAVLSPRSMTLMLLCFLLHIIDLMKDALADEEEDD